MKVLLKTSGLLSNFPYRQPSGASMAGGALALLGAAVMLMLKFNAFSMWFDEVNMASNALAWNPFDLNVYLRPSGHPPLYFALLKTWTIVAGEADFSLRTFSILSAMLTAALVFRIGADLARVHFGGVAAALLFAAMGFVRYRVHETHNYALLMMIAMLLLFFYQRWWAHSRQKVYAIGVVLSTTALMLTHYFGVFVVAALNLHMILAHHRRLREALRWFVLQLMALLLYVPWIVAWVSQYQSNFAAVIEESGGDALAAASNWPSVVSIVELLLSDLTIVYGTLLAIGLAGFAMVRPASFKQFRKALAPLLLLVLFVLGSFGLALLVNIRIRLLVARRIVYVLPAFAIMLAYLLARLPVRLRWPILAVAVGVTFAGSWSSKLPGNWRFRQALELIEENGQPNDIIFVQAGGDAFIERPFRYYARHGLSEDTLFLTLNDFDEISLFNQHNQEIFANELFLEYIWARERFWVIRPVVPTMGEENLDWVQAIEGREFVEAETFRRGWMTISLLSAPPLERDPLPSEVVANHRVLSPLRTTLGDEFELVDYYVSNLSAQAGDQIGVWLDWRALRKPDKDYAVYVHLLEDNTTIHGQIDGEPSHLGVPIETSIWPTDTIIYDSYTFRINEETPPGIYQLKVGLYDRETMQRLPVTLSDGTISDGIVLGEIEVY